MPVFFQLIGKHHTTIFRGLFGLEHVHPSPPIQKNTTQREGGRWQIFPSDVARLRVSAAPFTFSGFVTLKMGEADGRHGVIFGESFCSGIFLMED